MKASNGEIYSAMLRNNWNFVFVLLSTSLIIFRLPNCSASTACSRKLNTTVLCPSKENPCMTENGTVININLVHTKAIGANDTIHYIFSTWGIPSVLIAKTSVNAHLEVNYSMLLNESVTKQSIRFMEFGWDVHADVFVVMVAQVIDYDDVNDKVDRLANESSIEYDLSYSTWDTVTVNSGIQFHDIVFNMSRGLNEEQQEPAIPPLNPGGSVYLTFRAPCDDGYYHEAPNLQYNSNMCLADIVLNNVSTKFNHSRLAIQLIVAATTSKGSNMTIEKYRSIDDEHSPGSFVTMNWLTNVNQALSDAFLQWKPTSYTKPVRNLQSLSGIQQDEKLIGPFPYSFDRVNITKRGLAYEYWSENLMETDKVNIASGNIMFGLPGDKFYNNSQYDAWSFSFGFGVPPSDKISLAIIMVIIIGLGIPVVLTIAGAVYICIRKYRRHNGYEEITNSYGEIN